MLLCHISLLSVVECDPRYHPLFSLEGISNSLASVSIPHHVVLLSAESLVDTQNSRSPLSLYDSCSVVATEASFGVPVCMK